VLRLHSSEPSGSDPYLRSQWREETPSSSAHVRFRRFFPGRREGRRFGSCPIHVRLKPRSRRGERAGKKGRWTCPGYNHPVKHTVVCGIGWTNNAMVAEQKPIGFELPKRSSYLSRSQSFESKPEDELPSAPKRAPPERERPMPRNLFPVYPRSGMGNGFEDEEVSVWEGIVLVYEKFVSAVLDIAASGFVFCAVQTMESIIVLCIAAGATSFFYFYQDGDISVRLDWFFVSFAVVFPLVFFIGEGHRRREFALENLGQLKSSTLNYYLAHRDWVTDTELPQGHVALVTSLLGSLLSDMIAYFLTPRIYTRNYFYWGWRGKKMIAWIEANRKFHLGRISASVKKMSTCNKRLKAAGLEAGEKSRLEQYQSLITTSFYKMSNVKEYRWVSIMHGVRNARDPPRNRC